MTELIQAFSIKLHPSIAKELLSCDVSFKSLSNGIEGAKRHEPVETSFKPVQELDNLHAWKPVILFWGPKRLNLP